MQNIVYSEYLPVFLDNVTMVTYGLRVQVEGHVDVYDSNVDATVSNAFSTAAFRFGHTTIPNNQVSLSESYQHLTTVDIAKTFHNPNMTYHHCDGVARWLVNDTGIASDGLFVDGVRNLLFRDAQNISTDLPARNIQRGRDHGLPAYNQWRRYCYFTVISQEQFAMKGTPMGNFSTETSDKFRQIYEHADDIDLFSGAMKEIPLPGAQVGPVFACLLGNEFRRLKIGDRFYFENPSPQSGPETGFTPEQLTSLRAIRLSKIICLTMNAPTIQKYVFHPTSETNSRVTCESLPEIDFSKWRTSA
ncbi:hypothetical protein DPMN_170413 [Dreissena polymorpha]|uniref:Peroxidase n=2 Tax=Dreissena polymorpha TaxID=45954 RepID=A0A9D4DW99_DREPO|nr:hypothetical protein DPMN_170413 [Dreissena polymorpha]